MTTKEQALDKIKELQQLIEDMYKKDEFSFNWKPESNADIWSNGAHRVSCSIFTLHIAGKRLLKLGQLFRTEEQLNTYNRVLDRIIELDDGWETDWVDNEQEKRYIRYNPILDNVSSQKSSGHFNQGTIYLQKSTAEILLDEFTKDELKIFVGVIESRTPIDVTDVLEEAAQLFQQYADHHDAKGQGHEHKVKRNQEMADKCKAALNNRTKEGSK